MYGNQPLHLAQNRRSKLSLSFFGLSLHHHILNLANHQSKPPRKQPEILNNVSLHHNQLFLRAPNRKNRPYKLFMS